MKLNCPFRGTFRITQKFKENPDAYKKFGLAGHDGVDWATPTGTDLIAPMDGKTYVGWAPTTWGLFYSITNDWGTVYLCHLKENFVPSGVQVQKTQLIGHTDNTGNSTGPHIHVGLRVKGIKDPGMKDFVDPLPYFEQEETVPDAKEEKQNGIIETYKEDVDEIRKALKMPMSDDDIAHMVGRIKELLKTEENYKNFVKAVAQGIGCAEVSEKACREALVGLEARILAIKEAKLASFDAWEKIISGITDLFRRR